MSLRVVHVTKNPKALIVSEEVVGVIAAIAMEDGQAIHVHPIPAELPAVSSMLCSRCGVLG